MIGFTFRSAFPVLHTLTAAVAVLPEQVLGKLMRVGTWIWGVQQTTFAAKNKSICPLAGVPGGGVADAQTLYNRPAEHALPL